MRLTVLASLAVLAAAPASANVHEVADAGFVLRHSADVSASPDDTWRRLITPSAWWSGVHSYSGNAANFTLDPMAGGCFCEVLPNPDSPRAAPRGSVEHMRVIYAEQGRVLRLSGALGPLQSSAASGTLTIVLKPIDGGTRMMWEYVVGGYLRSKPQDLAPIVDQVLGEQLGRLAGGLGPHVAGAGAATGVPTASTDTGR